MDIQEKTGTTFVIVTHDQEEAMTVASRVAVMDAGVIKQVDTPPAIYETPNSVYVADFIGDVNLIEGTAAKTGEHAYEITYAEGVDPIKVTECEHEIAEGAKVTFAIRPEKILITADQPQSNDNALRGKVVDIAYLGNLSTYHVELPGGQMVKATMTNASRISRRDYTWEDTVWLGFRSSAGVVLSE